MFWWRPSSGAAVTRETNLETIEGGGDSSFVSEDMA